MPPGAYDRAPTRHYGHRRGRQVVYAPIRQAEGNAAMTMTHEAAELVTRGWAPGAAVALYYHVDQEARRALGEPPTSAPGGARPPLVQGTADAKGVLTVSVASNTPLLAYGQRADPRDPRWVQTMAHPAWQKLT